MTDLRAQSVKQPHADLLVAGVKDVENRSKPIPRSIADTSGYEYVRPWECAYYRGVGQCSFGCHDEPGCITGEPKDGYPFPVRVLIHASLTVDHPPLEYEDGHYFFDLTLGADELGQVTRHIESGEWTLYLPPEHMPRPLVLGAIVGAVTFVGQHHADTCQHYEAVYPPAGGAPDQEVAWCSRFAQPDNWHYEADLATATRFDTPIPCRGALGWWRPPADVLARLPGGVVT